MDPGYGYNQYEGDPASEAAESPTEDNAPAPSETAPMQAPPGPSAAAPVLAPAPQPASPEDGQAIGAIGPTGPTGDDQALEDGQPLENNQPVAEGAPGPAVPADPTAGVTNPEIDAALDGYGQWVETDDYGQVWRPDATVVGVDFTPYESGGSWEYTDAGWAFSCEYPWGWLPFHYGRWAWFHDYWGWVPGHKWGPAWVEWRHGGGVVGWRPLGPRTRDHRSDGRVYHHGSGPSVRDHRHPEQHDAHWRFATVPDFGRPHIRSHLYGNLGEGLRVTQSVAAPPLRARTTVHTGDLMRNRFATGGRWNQPGSGRYVGPQVRDHRSPTPYNPSYPPARTVQPTDAYRPPARTQPYNPPTGTYQPPPIRRDTPVRTYQPPPIRRDTPSVRTYQPPPRTFQPSPGRPSAPPRASTPHAPSSPPSRPWHPAPSSGGSHSSPSSSSHSSGGGSSHSSSGGSSHSSSGGSSHSSSGGGSHSGGGGHHR
jgi:hypothetical protein